MAATRFFLHLDDPTFERFGGVYLPFNTRDEAERQAAVELGSCGDDPAAIGLLGIFKAAYGGHRRISAPPPHPALYADRFDYDKPHGHLDPERRQKVATPAQLARGAKKLRRTIDEEGFRAEAERLIAMKKAIESGEAFTNSVPGNAYTWMTGGTATATPAALTAATAKTVVLLLAGTSNQPAVTEFGVSFDGVTATAVPVLVELVSGTAGTAGTPRVALAAGKQVRGWPAQASVTTCGDTYSAEPATQLVNKKWYVSPNGGLFAIQSPLGREPTAIITAATDAKTWSLRLTAPATVNAHAYLEYEE